MLRTGAQYLDGIRDGREVYLGGERVRDVTTHSALAPIIRARASMYDMAHETAHAGTLAYSEGNDSHSIFNRPPTTKADWHAKWRAVDAVLNDLGGVVTCVGDETRTAATYWPRSTRASPPSSAGTSPPSSPTTRFMMITRRTKMR